MKAGGRFRRRQCVASAPATSTPRPHALLVSHLVPALGLGCENTRHSSAPPSSSQVWKGLEKLAPTASTREGAKTRWDPWPECRLHSLKRFTISRHPFFQNSTSRQECAVPTLSGVKSIILSLNIYLTKHRNIIGQFNLPGSCQEPEIDHFFIARTASKTLRRSELPPLRFNIKRIHSEESFNELLYFIMREPGMVRDPPLLRMARCTWVELLGSLQRGSVRELSSANWLSERR